MSAGKLFQRAGPATENALAPTVERRTGGTRRWLDDEDDDDYEGEVGRVFWRCEG